MYGFTSPTVVQRSVNARTSQFLRGLTFSTFKARVELYISPPKRYEKLAVSEKFLYCNIDEMLPCNVGLVSPHDTWSFESYL